jgi:hypothetical protein
MALPADQLSRIPVLTILITSSMESPAADGGIDSSWWPGNTAVFTGFGYLDSAPVLDAQIAFCRLMTRQVSNRHLTQVIHRPALQPWPVTVLGGTPSGACRPGDAGLGGAPGMTFQ